MSRTSKGSSMFFTINFLLVFVLVLLCCFSVMKGATIYYEVIVLYCNRYVDKLLSSDTVSISLTPMWDRNRISYLVSWFNDSTL